MNRIKRDYCSKGKHPNWRAWHAKYDMSVISWPLLGEFCTYCGAMVHGVASGAPSAREAGRLRVLRYKP